MPSQNNSSLGGFNKPVAGNPDNRTVSVYRGGGSAVGSGLFDLVGLQRPAVFDGSSNDQIANFLGFASGVGPRNIGAAGTGTVRDSRERRKRAEVAVGNLMVGNQDGLTEKTYDRQTLIQGTGVRQLRDGRYLSVTGAVIVSSGFPTVTGSYVRSAGSGTSGYGDNAATPGRLRGQSYNFKMGISRYNQSLDRRTN